MLKMLKRTTSVFLACVMLAGCAAQSGGTQPTTTPQTPATAKPTEANQGVNAPVENLEVYPLSGNRKLTYWVGVTSSNTATTNDDIPFWQELQARTGVDIEFIHPVVGQDQEQFNLMLASTDYPDIIESKSMETGTLFSKKVIADLTDMMPEYSPNYYNFLQEHEGIRRQVTSDDGRLLLYGFIRLDPISQTTTGPIIRKDWLDKLNMAVPETIEDWETMLTAFKNEIGAEIPYGARSAANINMIAGAWNFYLDFYHDDGVVKYGHIEPQFKDYIGTLARWYSNGLIDKNFATADKATQDSNFLINKQGTSFGAAGGQLGTWMTAAKDNGNTGFQLIGAKFPVLNKGETPGHYVAITQMEYSNGNPWVMISTKCKDMEAAMRLLDYGYGEEGKILYNHGLEGVSFNIVDGAIVPLLEDEIKEKYGLSSADFKKSYTRSADSGPFILDSSTLKFSQSAEQAEALANWSINNNKDHKIPPIVLSTEESAEFSAIMADIKTYNDEMLVRFIMGVESLDNIQKYWDTIKGMNIDRALQIQQEALDRYFDR